MNFEPFSSFVKKDPFQQLDEPVRLLVHKLPGEAQQYLADLIAEELSLLTVKNYVYDLNLLWDFCKNEGIGDIAEIDHALLKSFFQYLANGYERIVYTKLMKADPKTGEIKEQWVEKRYFRKNSLAGGQARKVSTYNSFFDYLLRNNAISVNPMKELEKKKASKRGGSKQQSEPMFLTYQECLDYLAAINKYYENREEDKRFKSELEIRDRAIILLFLNSGLRVSELCSLNTESIRLHRENTTLSVLGKGKKNRTLHVNEQTFLAISSYLDARPKKIPKEHQHALFLNRDHTRISRKAVYEIVKKYARVANIDETSVSKLSPHKLRHTFATLLLQNGANIKVVQELLGHENISTTNIYVHAVDREKEAAISSLNRLFSTE
ncbi:tyrosine-type recombinase/integrase [Ammoniphilus sp. YIM 78166]|uniref:tyrosine-type recombinase/integrase n=1 Tax=Ammoniphilus sp. YIM 78166 TaxID=1644106 RepID=UPI00106F8564|nr:tyrosine-type recombinase/integrase [Ammoniphilus sp. YIM 78166]